METVKPLNYDVLVDSDAFVAFVWGVDALHEQAKQLFDQAIQRQLKLVTTSFVVVETATVLSDLSGQEDARYFLEMVEDVPTIHITEALQEASLELFKAQNKRHISVIDCSNLIVMKQYSIPQIYSFDKFYRNQLGLKAA